MSIYYSIPQHTHTHIHSLVIHLKLFVGALVEASGDGGQFNEAKVSNGFLVAV